MPKLTCPSGHAFVAKGSPGDDVLCSSCGAVVTVPAPADVPKAAGAPKAPVLAGFGTGALGLILALVAFATNKSGQIQKDLTAAVTDRDRLKTDLASAEADLQKARADLQRLQRQAEEAAHDHKTAVDRATSSFETRLKEAEAKVEEERKRYAALAEKIATNPTPTQPTPGPGPATTPEEPKQAEEVAKLFEQCRDSVVMVKTDNGFGSGFFITTDGMIVTNQHVIAGAKSVSCTVVLRTGANERRESVLPAVILAVDASNDLALLKVSLGGGSTCQVLPLRLEGPKVGEKAVAIGNPGFAGKALELTVTEGIVSGPIRDIEGSPCVQTTAPINPGNSGGPLIGLDGRVLGVVAMKARAMEGTAFAIAASAVQKLVEGKDSTYKYDPSKNVAGGGRPKITRDGCREIEIGAVITDIVIDDRNGLIYALDAQRGQVTNIEFASGKIVKQTFVGDSPMDMAMDPSSGELYIALPAARMVVRMNPREGKIKEQIEVGVAPSEVRWVSKDKRLLFNDAKSGQWFSKVGADKWYSLALRGSLVHDPSRDMVYAAQGNQMVAMNIKRTEDLARQIGDAEETMRKATTSPERRVELSKKIQTLTKQMEEERKVHTLNTNLTGARMMMVGGKLVAGRVIFEPSKLPNQKGAFALNPHSLSRDPDLKAFFDRYPELSFMYAVSKDGKWAVSGTYLYDAQTLEPVKELPGLSITSEFTSDSKSVVMFDVVTQTIVIMPAAK